MSCSKTYVYPLGPSAIWNVEMSTAGYACNRPSSSEFPDLTSHNGDRCGRSEHHQHPHFRPRCGKSLFCSTSSLTILSGGGLWTPSNPIHRSSDLLSFSHVRNSMRLEDSRLGGLRNASSSPLGIRATIDEQLGRWQDREVQKQAGIAPHQRIGIGLPMSNIYAT